MTYVVGVEVLSAEDNNDIKTINCIISCDGFIDGYLQVSQGKYGILIQSSYAVRELMKLVKENVRPLVNPCVYTSFCHIELVGEIDDQEAVQG